MDRPPLLLVSSPPRTGSVITGGGGAGVCGVIGAGGGDGGAYGGGGPPPSPPPRQRQHQQQQINQDPSEGGGSAAAPSDAIAATATSAEGSSRRTSSGGSGSGSGSGSPTLPPEVELSPVRQGRRRQYAHGESPSSMETWATAGTTNAVAALLLDLPQEDEILKTPTTTNGNGNSNSTALTRGGGGGGVGGLDKENLVGANANPSIGGRPGLFRYANSSTNLLSDVERNQTSSSCGGGVSSSSLFCGASGADAFGSPPSDEGANAAAAAGGGKGSGSGGGGRRRTKKGSNSNSSSSARAGAGSGSRSRSSSSSSSSHRNSGILNRLRLRKRSSASASAGGGGDRGDDPGERRGAGPGPGPGAAAALDSGASTASTVVACNRSDPTAAAAAAAGLEPPAAAASDAGGCDINGSSSSSGATGGATGGGSGSGFSLTMRRSSLTSTPTSSQSTSAVDSPAATFDPKKFPLSGRGSSENGIVAGIGAGVGAGAGVGVGSSTGGNSESGSGGGGLKRFSSSLARAARHKSREEKAGLLRCGDDDDNSMGGVVSGLMIDGGLGQMLVERSGAYSGNGNSGAELPYDGYGSFTSLTDSLADDERDNNAATMMVSSPTPHRHPSAIVAGGGGGGGGGGGAAMELDGTSTDDPLACPLTPVADPSSANHNNSRNHPNSLRNMPPAILDTPPAASVQPLIVSAKKLGSEVRRRHGAKRRKGSSRRTKAGRKAKRLANKATAAAAGEAGGGYSAVADDDGDGVDGEVVGLPMNAGCPRRLAAGFPPARNGPEEWQQSQSQQSSSQESGSLIETPTRKVERQRVVGFSVDDSFDSDDDDDAGGKTEASTSNSSNCDGSVSRRLGEMDLSPTHRSDGGSGSGTLSSATSSVLAHKNGRHGGPRDISMDLNSVVRLQAGPAAAATTQAPLLLTGPPEIERRRSARPRSSGDGGAFPTADPSSGAFPTASSPNQHSEPSSPASSLSGSEAEEEDGVGSPYRSEEEERGVIRYHSERSSYSSSSSDGSSDGTDSSDTSDDSTVCTRGYPPLPRPPESATREERSRFYWEICYGAPPPTATTAATKPALPPSGRSLAAGLVAMAAGTGTGGAAAIVGAGSWSAGRLPPAKSCLSSKKKKPWSLPKAASSVRAAHSTPTLCDRFNYFNGDGSNRGSGGSMAAAASGGRSTIFNPSPLANESIGESVQLTPTNGSPVADQDMYDEGGDSILGRGEEGEGSGDDRKKPRLNVKFGTPSAAEFDFLQPSSTLTPLPNDVARERFPVEEKEEPEEKEVMHKATVENSAMLAEWEDDFDSFLEDESEGGGVCGGDNGGADGGRDRAEPMHDDDNSASSEGSSSNASGDDWIPRSRPKRPRKKKRRRSKHHGKDGRDDRRSSNFFFSPGGGSLLGCEEEEDGTVDDHDHEQEQEERQSSSPGDDEGHTVTNALSSFSPQDFTPDAALDQSPGVVVKEETPSVDMKPADFVSPTSSESFASSNTTARTETPNAERFSSTALLRSVHSSGGAICLAPTSQTPANKGRPVVSRQDGAVHDEITQEGLRPNHLGSVLDSCQDEDDTLSAYWVDADARVGAGDIRKFLCKMAQVQKRGAQPEVELSDFLNSHSLNEEDNNAPSQPRLIDCIGAIDSALSSVPRNFENARADIRGSLFDSLSSSVLSSVADLKSSQELDTNGATVAEICSRLLQIALHEWRTHEVFVMVELTKILREWARKCNEELINIDQRLADADSGIGAVSREKTALPERQNASKKIQTRIADEMRALEVIEAAVDYETRDLETSLKKHHSFLSVALHKAAQPTSVPRCAYQLLSHLMPVQVNHLGEDVLESTFRSICGSRTQRTQVRWTFHCGANDATNSPAAIQNFAIFSHTSIAESESARRVGFSDTVQRFHGALLHSEVVGKCHSSVAEETVFSSIDCYIMDQAKRESNFPSAFLAVSDLLCRLNYTALDIMLMEEKGFELEVVQADSMVGLLVKVSRGNAISLGIQFIYDQDDTGRVKLLPTAVSVISLGGDVPAKLEKLQDLSDSVLQQRQLCNAFLLNETCDAIIHEVDRG